MKTLILSALTVAALSFGTAAQASSVYSSKANTSTSPAACGCSSVQQESTGCMCNSKLGQNTPGSQSGDTVIVSKRAQCSKCSS